MAVLDNLFTQYKFPHTLYSKIKKNIEFNRVEDAKCSNDFINDLPHNLRTPISIYVYKNLYNKVDFLKNKDGQFIAWICPLLKSRIATSDEVIYYEGDPLENVYFLKTGQCFYVLPKYGNTPYIRIEDHTCFGLTDIIVALMEKTENNIRNEGMMSVLDKQVTRKIV
jgi:hypothetical protein